ncbi:hypothetical protein X742_05715 [Mesorhizobium sp. LNHC232B00]|nr:hypothetical protein X742_05715 [Mesorhizobium sp. LNHC232B00]
MFRNPAVGGGGGSDPNFANVVLLCGFNGVDAATSSTDESSSAKTLTFTGNAQLDTAQQKFGTASLLLDGSGDTVSVPDSADWVFPGEFTIEFFARSAWPAGIDYFLIQDSGAGNTSFRFSHNSNSAVDFLFSTDGSNIAHQVNTTSAGLTSGVWSHFAIDRDSSGKMRLYIDGVMKGSKTGATGTNFNSSSVLSLGGHVVGFGYFNGWLDELRITKGVARYGSDGGFTVPAAAYPRS